MSTDDPRFVREGVSLREWIERLVSDDAIARGRAAEALQAIQVGIPSVHSPPTEADLPDDPESWEQDLRSAVRSVVRSDAFDLPIFLECLVALHAAGTEQNRRRADRWLAASDRQSKRFDRIADELTARIRRAGTDHERERGIDRLAKAAAIYLRSACEPISDPEREAERIFRRTGPWLAACALLDWLGDLLLEAPTAFAVLWDTDASRALRILEDAGPAGAVHADRVLRELRRAVDTPHGSRGTAEAPLLGSLSGERPEIVAEMTEWLRTGTTERRVAAALFFGRLGPGTGPRADEVLELLEARFRVSKDTGVALRAFASVGRDRPEVRRTVRAWAAPRSEPLADRWTGETWGFDQVMTERGHALAALESFVAHADECLPILVEALDSFEEQDPDETYLGPQARIAQVLEAFGPAGASAAEALARHLDAPGEDFPRAIVDALAAMGDGARDALPHLEAFHRSIWTSDEWREAFPDAHPDRLEDPIGWLIERLSGRIRL